MKSKLMIIAVILAVALMAAPAMANTTAANLYFTVGNITGSEGTEGLGQFTLGPGQYFADLKITVDDTGTLAGVAQFDLIAGQGSYNGNPVNFAFVGTGSVYHLLGLSVNPTTGSSGFALTLTNPTPTFLVAGSNPTVTVYQGNPGEKFDGWGNFNTGLNVSAKGWGGGSNAVTEVTFNSTQTFSNVDEVLAALVANGNGWLGAVDMGGYYPTDKTAAILTGSAHNGFVPVDPNVNPVPIPPSALLLGSGLLGMGFWGWRRRERS